MNNLRSIRKRLGLTQGAVTKVIGGTQGSISLYETGERAFPVDKALLLVEEGRKMGIVFSLDDIYAVAQPACGHPPAEAAAKE